VNVLGISSSPRRNGNTDTLLNELLKGASEAGAETKLIVLRDIDFRTCLHCDNCLKTGNCSIKDDVQQVYPEMERADVIVAASPVQFMGPTATLKALIDRCQCLWSRKYVLKRPPLDPAKKRTGFFISLAGTRFKNMFDPSIAIVKTWFHVIDVEYAGELTANSIDEKGAILKHPELMQQAYETGRRLVQEAGTGQ